jgi:hypothetical protein
MSIGFVSDLGEYYFQHQQIESVTENSVNFAGWFMGLTTFSTIFHLYRGN